MKKRILLATLFLIVVVASSSAQLLWKVNGKNTKAPSYLFGTHHLIEKEKIKDFDKIMTIVAASDAVVGEIDMTDMKAVQAVIMQSAIMTGKTMKDLLKPDDYSLVDTEFKGLFGAGLDQLGMMKPMMLQTLYSVTIYAKSQNITKQPEGIDVLFQNKAKELNKPVIAFETSLQQAGILFDSIPYPRQAEILVKSIQEKDKGINLLNQLNQAYLTGNLKKMEELDKTDDDMTPTEKKYLFDNRNNAWMKKIPALINQQSCFIAVGCLHLTGATGLIEQLRKAGYTVSPVL